MSAPHLDPPLLCTHWVSPRRAAVSAPAAEVCPGLRRTCGSQPKAEPRQAEGVGLGREGNVDSRVWEMHRGAWGGGHRPLGPGRPQDVSRAWISSPGCHWAGQSPLFSLENIQKPQRETDTRLCYLQPRDRLQMAGSEWQGRRCGVTERAANTDQPAVAALRQGEEVAGKEPRSHSLRRTHLKQAVSAGIKAARPAEPGARSRRSKRTCGREVAPHARSGWGPGGCPGRNGRLGLPSHRTAARIPAAQTVHS